MARELICPICGRPARPRPENRAAPFCSDRCRLIDLGNWLGENYRIAGPLAGDGLEAPSRRVDEEDEDA